MELNKIYSSFKIAKRLAAKQFYLSEYNKPPFTKEWYNEKGETVSTPTHFPRTDYFTIRLWLESEGVLFVTDRPQPEGPLFSRVFVRIYDGKDYPPGKEPYRRRGRIEYFEDYDEAEAATLERAISAVIPLPF